MASIEGAHATVLRDGRLQFDLPDAAPRQATDLQPLPHLVLKLAPWIVWTLAGIAAVIVAIVIWRAWQTRSTQTATVPPPERASIIPAAAARKTLAEADALAGEGRFTEAAHALLACGVDEIARRFPTLLRPATTSRGIAALAELPPTVRHPFARIAAIVEVGIFGDRPISADGYAECRQAFVTSALAGPS